MNRNSLMLVLGISLFFSAFSANAQSSLSQVNITSQEQKQADRFNSYFQQNYDPSNNSERWTGGDGVFTVDLPYCAACTGKEPKDRKLWLFGDSYVGVIGRNNIREAGLVNIVFGNTMAITPHSTKTTPMFDWGQGHSPWMPLLLDTTTLSSENSLRIAVNGYLSMTYGRMTKANPNPYYPRPFIYAYRDPWIETPGSLQPNIWSVSMSRDTNLIPIYEYYNSSMTFHDYSTQHLSDGTSGYQDVSSGTFERIAFWVYKTQMPDTVPLYRYYSPCATYAMLTTLPDLLIDPSNFGYTARVLLGYVYTDPSKAVRHTYPAERSLAMLTEYFRFNWTDGSDFKYVLQDFSADPNNPGEYIANASDNDNGSKVLMWPGTGVIIGNDLVQLFSPVGNGAEETNIVAIVKGVNRPYARWGKTMHGNWTTPPAQYALTPSNAANGILWGVLFKDSASNYVYIYGTKSSRNDPSNTHYENEFNLVVARVACNSAEDFVKFSNWQYYNGTAWVNDENAAAPIAYNLGPNLSNNTIIKNPNKANSYIILTQRDASSLTFLKGQSLTGPFLPISSFNLDAYINEASVTTIYDDGSGSANPDNGKQGHYPFYATGMHPGLSSKDVPGIMIDYVRWPINGTDFQNLSVYVPRFVNLPWAAIDP